MIAYMIGGGPQDGLAWIVPELPPWLVFPYLARRPQTTPDTPLVHYRAVYVQVGDTDRYTYVRDERY